LHAKIENAKIDNAYMNGKYIRNGNLGEWDKKQLSINVV
jgi:hypothetical protein